MNHDAVVASAAFVPPGATIALRGESRVDLRRSLAARLELRLRVADSRGPHGPRVALRASLLPPPLFARLILRHRNRTRGREREEVVRQIAIVPPDLRIERAGGRMRSMPAGELFAVRLMDYESRVLAWERTLGDLQDGLSTFDLPVPVEVAASAWVIPREWSERRGPTLKLCGALTFRSGLVLRVGTRSRRDAGRRNAELPGIDLPLVRPGLSPHYDERVLEGLPLNWWALLAFRDERDQAVGEEHLIGRFVAT